MRERLQDAYRVLRGWAHPRHRTEATTALIQHLLATYPPEALDALENLRKAPQFIRSAQSVRHLRSEAKSKNFTAGHRAGLSTVAGLLDSGATNGFINAKLVEENGLEMEPLPLAVPVYNADGTANKGGRITHVV
ncbi:hypothetical protein B0H17DRAFT_960785 [Mycena rosella]|uniref:Uncharacterized protein n=1 Tax=Mycena rosella TaxID=1033263 RepID=A0AAD7FUD3_MYCRO|nr:hypothetical protein B0H17DRAFT_960785 [Mycena rosella]